jgi:pimeloyl-ACP methyl ester carboxylesterase
LHAGFSEGDWKAAQPLVQQYMQYLADGQGRDALLEAIDAARKNGWSSVVNLARVMPAAIDRGKWTWVATYDPAADIRAMHMPVLVLLGGHDPFLPSGVAIRRWQEALAVAGNVHDLVVSYPPAGHGIRTNGHAVLSTPEYAPGYLENQLAWLRGIGALH